MTLITKHNSSEDNIFKPHSFITILALILPYVAISLLKDVPIIPLKILIIGALIVGLVLAVMAAYEWRKFFSMRKKGLNHDKNYFFEESAGKYRKTVFHLSLFSYLVFKLFRIGDIKGIDLKYILKTEFYQLVFFNIIKIIFLIIVLVELSRILFPSAAKWSYKKHLLVVLLLSLTVSIFQTILIKILSGHGIF